MPSAEVIDLEAEKAFARFEELDDAAVVELTMRLVLQAGENEQDGLQSEAQLRVLTWLRAGLTQILARWAPNDVTGAVFESIYGDEADDA